MIVLEGRVGRDQGDRVWFSPDGRGLVVATQNGLRIWRDFAASDEPTTLYDLIYVWNVQFTPDGKRLFAANNEIHLVDLKSMSTTVVPLWNGSGAFFGLSSSGEQLIVGQTVHGPRNKDTPTMAARKVKGKGAFLWTRDVGTWFTPPLFLPGDKEFVRLELPLKSTGWRIVTHSTKTGEEVRSSGTLIAYPGESVLSADGSLLAGFDGLWVRVYPVTQPSEKPIASIKNDNKKRFTGIAFHPSGKYLATASNDATVKFYDTTSWQVAKAFTWDIGKMRSVAFSPDGTLAAAGSGTGKVVVWDVDL
ncbi:MAG: hypothetical protein K8U57_34820 [Planctomycetes bacterium]|nr:hypothetical protein [Planctomycetota bacterium]